MIAALAIYHLMADPDEANPWAGLCCRLRPPGRASRLQRHQADVRAVSGISRSDGPLPLGGNQAEGPARRLEVTASFPLSDKEVIRLVLW